MRPEPKKVSCLLIHPDDASGRMRIIAMGLFAIASLLQGHGFRTRILHAGLAESKGGIPFATDLWNVSWSLIGISCHWAGQLHTSLELARRLKAMRPKSFLVLGGFSASCFAGEIMDGYPFVDGVIRGEGEQPMLSLAESLEEFSPLEAVPNLVWRRDGRIFVNEISYVASSRDLDKLEFADLTLLHDYPAYRKTTGLIPVSGMHFDVSKTFYLCAGRGCPVICSFCGGGRTCQQTISNRKQVTFRSPESTLKTIEKARGFGYTNFYVSFDPDPGRKFYLRLFELIRSRQLDITMTFGCWSLPGHDFIDDFARTFPQGGLFEISPETADERLRRLNRGFFFSNSDMERAISRIGANSLYCQVYFSYFLPSDNEETINRTRRYAWELVRRYGDFTDVYYLSLSTDPASPLQSAPDLYGLQLETRSLEDYLQLVRQKRVGNFLSHYPVNLGKERAREIEAEIAVELFLRRAFALSLKAWLKSRPDPGALMERLQAFRKSTCPEGLGSPEEIDLARLVTKFANFLSVDADEAAPAWLGDLLRYEAAKYLLGLSGSGDRPQPEIKVQAAGRSSDDEHLFSRLPRFSRTARLESFDHDVLRIIAAEPQGASIGPPATSPMPGKKMHVVLQLSDTDLRHTLVNEEMKEILEQCNGDNSVRDILAHMLRYYALPCSYDERIFRDTLHSLRQLSEMNIVELK